MWLLYLNLTWLVENPLGAEAWYDEEWESCDGHQQITDTKMNHEQVGAGLQGFVSDKIIISQSMLNYLKIFKKF